MASPAEVYRMFKADHRLIADNIFQIQDGKSYAQIKPLLMKFQERILNHLGSQDKDFYAGLRDFYRNDRQKLKMLEFLEYDITDLKIQTLTFMDEHPVGMQDPHAKKFSWDFDRYARLILARFKAEENYLFPLLQEYELK